jgi:hypothetical protein
MPISRPIRTAHRGLLAAAAAVLAVTACDTTSSFSPSQQRWGFVYATALRNTAGEYRMAPNAQFFLGTVTSVPDARLRTDSCFAAGEYVAPGTGGLTGVTYLDAGAAFTATIGGAATSVPRVSTGGQTTYGLATGATIAYRPGDSVIVSVPGAAGGYPASELRGRSAEPFTVDPVTPATTTIPLKWSAASDGNSSLIVSLQYLPAGASARTQEIRCAFTDDGVDSIPLRQHQAWSASTNVSRSVVFTRLRTAITSVDGGALQLISTFQVPTPTP